MNDFTVHTIAGSTGARKAALKGIEQRYGMVHNVIGGMAESPAAVNGYTGLLDALRQTTFSPPELDEDYAPYRWTAEMATDTQAAEWFCKPTAGLSAEAARDPGKG